MSGRGAHSEQDAPMTRAVIFDVDGTLIDTVDLHAECWVEALEHYDVRIPFVDMRVQIG
jgi:beta-phosphoglucomutase-like phosphatase (HAD superfamily)